MNGHEQLKTQSKDQESTQYKQLLTQPEQGKKFLRYHLQKMQSYTKFDIKGITRLQNLQQKRNQILNSYSNSKSNNKFRSRSKSKTKNLDMIIPSFQAFNINSLGLSGFNQFQVGVKDSRKEREREREKEFRPKSQSRNVREMRRGTSMHEQVNLSQIQTQMEIKLPASETKAKIYWHHRVEEVSKQLYKDIHNRNQSQTERKFRSKNIENIIRRRPSTNFAQTMAEYCRRMKLDENSRIFVFQSADIWLKEALLKRGWILNPDPTSKIFHLKWTSKISQQRADRHQLVNHFYESDLLTSKEGLAKVVRNSKQLRSLSPRSYDLGSELKEFVVDFNQTQILCGLKKIVKEIENYKLVPETVLDGKALGQAFKQMRVSEDYESSESQNGFILHIPYAVQLCAFCQNIRCDLQQLARQKYNRLNQKTSKNLFNFSLLNPPYSQYCSQSTTPTPSSTPPPKIHFNPTDPNLYTSPKSFSTPSPTLLALLHSYHSYFLSSLHTYRVQGTHNIWIVKNRNSSKGSGIMLSYNFGDLVRKTENKLVQKYVEECWLYRPMGVGDGARGYKYDLRVWVLVTCFDPLLCYFYQEFYCRLCAEPYSFEDLSCPERHLTNYSQNKQSFTSTSKPSILTHPQFLSLLSTQLTLPIPETVPVLTQKLSSLISHTLSPYRHSIKSHPECFQLYGFDILVAGQGGGFEMLLLEVNLSPACEERDEWLSGKVRGMGEGLVQIVVGLGKGEGWVKVEVEVEEGTG